MTNMSRRSHSRWNLSAKLVTEAKSARSTFHDSHDLHPVAASISIKELSTKTKQTARKRTRNRSSALALAATSDDELGGAHACEMGRSLEADARVGADDDDRLS